ncbi:hypothetical protein DFJ77DRAFT_126833 [Powellomyces hirtus]|nr:hypothetical protein DFJ77DRAFT_126833 [Powellomyces hirtus]
MRTGSVDLRIKPVAARYNYSVQLPYLESFCHKLHDTHPCTLFAHTAPPPPGAKNLKVNIRRLVRATGDIWGHEATLGVPLVNGGLEEISDLEPDEWTHENFMETVRDCVRNDPGDGRWNRRPVKKKKVPQRQRRGGVELLERPPSATVEKKKETAVSASPPPAQTVSVSVHAPQGHGPPMTAPTTEEIVQLLQQPQASRKPVDDRRLFIGLRRLQAFSKLSDFTVAQLMGVIHLNEIEANRTVFKQGDVATSWYIILRGRVDVLAVEQVQPNAGLRRSTIMAAASPVPLPPGAPAGTDPEFETRVVVTLGEGGHFGDLALSNNAKRNATIKTVEPCLLLRIEKEEYLRVVKFIHEKERQEKILFLKRCPALANNQNLSLIADAMLLKFHTKNQRVIRQDQVLTELCFIKSGVCGVYVHIELREDEAMGVPNKTLLSPPILLPQKKRHLKHTSTQLPDSDSSVDEGMIVGPVDCQIFLGHLRSGDYFGEQVLHYDDVDNKDAPVSSPITVRCMSAEVEIGHIQLHDARARLQEEQLPLSSLTKIALSKTRILERKAELLDAKRWVRFKKSSMDKLVREMMRDPNTSLEAFVRNRVEVKW